MQAHRNVWTVVVTLGLLIAGLLLFRALTGESSGDGRIARSASSREWQGPMVRRGLRELRDGQARGLQPLTEAQGKAEGMPEAMRRMAEAVLGGDKRLNLRFDQAQYVSTPTGAGVWIVEGEAVTCLFRDKTGASSCDTSANARRRGLLLEAYRQSSKHGPRRDFLALGVSPKGFAAVRVKIGGEVRTIPIVDGAYGYRAERPIRLVHFVR